MADNLLTGSSLPFALDDLLHQRTIESNRIEFKATWDDLTSEAVVRTACALSPTLVRRFLAEVGSKLPDEPLEDAALYRKLRIVAPVNAHEVPRNVGLLFFHEDPDRFFSGARIEVVRFPDDAGGDQLEEHVFRGPLPEQIRACLNYLEGVGGMLVRKRRDRPEAERTPAYPMAAVREALINAVYHRSYDGPPEPVKVYLYLDRLQISSYPGPLPGVELAHFQEGAEFPPVPARNRRIGDFLKELRLCETRGTGLPKIRRELRNIGSPPPEFRFDEGRTYFEITLPMHREHVLAAASQLMTAGRAADALGPLRRAFARQPGISMAPIRCSSGSRA